MDFIEFKANEENNQPLDFSDNEDENIPNKMDNFIDDTDQQVEGVSFYRQLDPENFEDYPKLPNSAKNPKVAVYEDKEPYFGEEDIQPKLYDPEDRNFVDFDEFDGFEKSVKKFKCALENFKDSENSFFHDLIYSLMFCKSEGKIVDKKKIEEVLGDDFYDDLLEIKDEIKLDRTIFGYFNRCFQVNEVLAKYNFLLKFFERRDMFRFLIQKKVQLKNKDTRDLYSSVIEKCNGYELIRPQLACQEKIEFIPINIAYEPGYNENTSVPCFFTD